MHYRLLRHHHNQVTLLCGRLYSTLVQSSSMAALECTAAAADNSVLNYCGTLAQCTVTPSSSSRFLSYDTGGAGRDIRQRIAKVTEKLDEKRKQFENKIATIPNALSLCRIGLTPVVGYLVVKESYAIALALFTVAGMTDWLDGYIARNVRNQRSLLGSIIDPVADKFLITTLFVTLTYVKLVPLLLTTLVILRDVGLIAGGATIRYRTMKKPVTLSRFFNPSVSPIQVTPTVVSKVNTALQMCVIACSLAAPVFDFTGHPTLTNLYIATAATTVCSGIQYARMTGMKLMKED